MCLYDSNLICLDIKTLDSSLNILGYANFQKSARTSILTVIKSSNTFADIEMIKYNFENDMHYKNYQRLINVTFIQKSL